MVYHCHVGHTCRVVYLYHLLMPVIHLVTYVRHCRYHVHVKLPVKPLLHYLHVQQTEKAAPETETQCHRTLRRECKTRIVQLQFLQTRTQILIVLCLNRIHAGKHHRLHLLKTLYRLLARTVHVSYRVAHLHLRARLYSRDDITHIARRNLLPRLHVKFQDSYLVCVILLARIKKTHKVALTHRPVNYLEISYDAPETVEYRVKH